MRKMDKIAIVATVVGMAAGAIAAGAIAGNTNTILANGFVMIGLILVTTRN